MAGLLAWAADVVGGNHSNDEDENNQFPTVIFTPEQQIYVRELDQKANSLRRSIQDLRLRIPPPDISQRLPHLHAHSLASNAALALQLNAHSSTKEEVQQRKIALQEENSAYEKAISDCEKKIQEKSQEKDLLETKLKEMDMVEKDLKSELENIQATAELNNFGESLGDPAITKGAEADANSTSDILEQLDAKRKELSSMEEFVEQLEKKWALVQQNSLRQPSPAQREKILDKQLHGLIEQLAAKQAQAESLVGEIHAKEKELEKLNGFRRGLENGNMDMNSTRYRFGRSSSGRFSSPDYTEDGHLKSSFAGGRTETQKRLMLLRSSFVLYILVLHILVFIKISF
ncbi:hypothetical protein AQUCO_00201038v1 [Aquilegia coerulea]|uniref:Uncharacterized protein n=1 Tax=Aquilegia coerulea TaxID=218851 RepID=A0A2G5F5Y2_AQUCA|nr:hypothetical protein AQUCO_00201038v1 [Aquilegia coerulea]